MEFASAPGLPDLPGGRVTGTALISLRGEWDQGKSNLIVNLAHMALRFMQSGLDLSDGAGVFGHYNCKAFLKKQTRRI